MKKQTIPAEIYQRVEPELLAGETLLWVGTPRAGHLPQSTRAAARAAVLSGLVAVLLGIGLLVLLRSGRLVLVSSPIVILILIFLLIMALAVSKYYRPALRNLLGGGSTTYAITDRRVLMLAGRSVQSYAASDIDFIERRMNRDGTGDILFKRESRRETVYSGVFSEQDVVVPVGLFGVDNPREVEALMLEVFRPGASVYAADEKPKHDDWVYEDELETVPDADADRADRQHTAR